MASNPKGEYKLMLMASQAEDGSEDKRETPKSNRRRLVVVECIYPTPTEEQKLLGERQRSPCPGAWRRKCFSPASRRALGRVPRHRHRPLLLRDRWEWQRSSQRKCLGSRSYTYTKKSAIHEGDVGNSHSSPGIYAHSSVSKGKSRDAS